MQISRFDRLSIPISLQISLLFFHWQKSEGSYFSFTVMMHEFNIFKKYDTDFFFPIIIQFFFHGFLIIFFLHFQTPYYQTENEKKQKKRIAPSVLTDKQKQLVADEMSDANLGLLCNVCGKIFKSRDALDFHIMYTKLPGHDVLQQVILCLFSRTTGRVKTCLCPFL